MLVELISGTIYSEHSVQNDVAAYLTILSPL